jgi:hypothetical protein
VKNYTNYALGTLTVHFDVTTLRLRKPFTWRERQFAVRCAQVFARRCLAGLFAASLCVVEICVAIPGWRIGPSSVNEDRPKPHPFALAMEWVAKITTVALEMVLPAVAGGYLDRRLGTNYWALVGVVVGLVVGMWHLLQMTRVKPHGTVMRKTTARGGGEAGSSNGPMQGEDKSGGSAGV